MAFSDHLFLRHGRFRNVRAVFLLREVGFAKRNVAMRDSTPQSLARWRMIVQRVRAELQSLRSRERGWMTARIEDIAELQSQMHERFLRADGSRQCGRCRGRCCDCGRNHFALVNLLGYLLQGQEPPEPDFDLPCPFLGEGGCRLDIARRPFNCVTFACEAVENNMSPTDRDDFYAEEAALRRLYAQFDGRYALSSPRGVLIRSARLADEPFLVPVAAEK